MMQSQSVTAFFKGAILAPQNLRSQFVISKEIIERCLRAHFATLNRTFGKNQHVTICDMLYVS